MSKATEAIKYMIAVWDEVCPQWRQTPDHVQQKFLEAEIEIKGVLQPTPTKQEEKE